MSSRGKRSRAATRKSEPEDLEFVDELPTDKALRRPGRPKGKNRKPLPEAQKKKRNNFYEKQRRDDHRLLYNQLAEGLSIDAKMTKNNILAAAIQKFRDTEDVADLKRINENLENQIAILLSRLGDDVNMSKLDSESDNDSEEISERPAQRRRLSIMYDSGIEDGTSTTASVCAETTPERQEEFDYVPIPNYSYEVKSEIVPKVEEICSLIPVAVYEALECETLIPQDESPLGPLPEGAQGSLSDIFDLQPYSYPKY